MTAIKIDSIPFRYRSSDTETGVTRATAKKLAFALGMDETQAIHTALRQLAVRVLPQYEGDDGPLTDDQRAQIKKMVPQKTKRSVKASLFDKEVA